MQDPKSIREAYVEASSFLSMRGVEEAGPSVELLLQHVLGWNRSRLLLSWRDPFPEEKEMEWQVLLTRRADGVPVQYLIGEQEFYGLPFTVGPAVLIPRPETEILVQEIAQRGRKLWPEEAGVSPLAADIGTGSGAIPVTLAVQCPTWRLAAVDISPEALAVARGNAERNGVGERVRFYEGDLLEPLVTAGVGVDILISNPPYIRSTDIDTLQAEVRNYEPHLALDGGEDGLDFYRRLVEGMKRLPQLPRLVGFEVGMGQAEEVAAMLRGMGAWTWLEIVKDLSGIDRHVLAER